MAHIKLKKLKKIANKAKGVKKLKTHSSVKKRFTLRSSGKISMTQANKQHNMIKHSTRQKKRQSGIVFASKVVVRLAKKFFRIRLNKN